MNLLITKLEAQHQELYKDLETILYELTKLKNHRDDEFLVQTTQKLMDYVESLLANHFQEEEELLFPVCNDQELIHKLIADHNEIRTKYQNILKALQSFDNSMDYKQELLFPAYNLIATINHHALREDRELFNQNSH